MDHQTALTKDQWLLFVTVPTLLFLISKLIISTLSSSKSTLTPPGPRRWPVVGNLLQLGGSPPVAFSEMAKLHGPLMTLKLGVQTLIVASSPGAAAEVLKTHDRLLSARYPMRFLLAEGVDLARVSFNWSPTCSERWRMLRSLCRAELFSPRTVASQGGLRRRVVGEMVEYFSGWEGRAVEVRNPVSVAVFNVLSNLLFSKDMAGFEGSESEDRRLKGLIDKLIEFGGRTNLAEFFPIMDVFNHLGFYRKCIKYAARVYAEWGDIVKERRERGFRSNDPRDFLDAMLERNFDDEQINRLTIELFSAGIDTTTTTVEWAMTELIRNKDAIERVREELITSEFDPSSADPESKLSELPFLNACYKETLRLHPPAPFLLPHFAAESCEVMNYVIPKNSTVIVNIWAIGRDPAVWDEPSVFKPERFLGSELDFKGSDFELLPFSSGRRICPGMGMGTKQVLYIMANLIHGFDWSLPDGQRPEDLDMSGKLGVTLYKTHPLVLVPKRRSS